MYVEDKSLTNTVTLFSIHINIINAKVILFVWLFIFYLFTTEPLERIVMKFGEEID